MPDPSLTVPDPRLTAPAPRQAARLPSLDWVKGALVVIMVVYHTINYSPYRPLAFEYLSFLPVSFIFITGFVVGQVYASRYDLNTWRPYFRLFTRGLKLLAIFIGLNVAFFIAAHRDVYDGFWSFFDRADAVFIRATGRVAIFEILLPIAYFLMLAPILLWLRSRMRAAVVLIAAASFLACYFLEVRGMAFKQFSLLSPGLIGMAAGLLPMVNIHAAAKKWILPLLAFIAYRIAESYFGERYAVQMLGAATSVFLLYAIALRVENVRGFWAWIVIIGQYSLLGYLVQIFLLRALVKVAHGQPQQVLTVILLGVTCLALTWSCIATTRFLRTKNKWFDLAYKLIFA